MLGEPGMVNAEAIAMPETKKVGRPKERPEGEQRFTARLPVRTYRLLKLLSDTQGISLNEALTKGAEEWISRQAGAEELGRVIDRTLTPPTPKKTSKKQ
jgi:hypothetical protein